jgi:hypothetical protein
MSDTPKHTPKPWEWEGTQTLWGGNPRAIVIEATVDGDDYGEHYGVIAHHWDDGVAGANRALIKAAPELLEALIAQERADWARRNYESISCDPLHPDREALNLEMIQTMSHAAALRKEAIAKAKP